MADPHRSDRVGRNVTPGLVMGVVLGGLVGGLVGLVVGLTVFGSGSSGMWGAIVAGGLFGLMVGTIWGGMARLGPPAEEDDPLPREPGGSATSADPPHSEVVE